QDVPPPQHVDLFWLLQSICFSLAFILSCTSHPRLPILCPLMGTLQEPGGGSHSSKQH
ncbi:hypothetical protein DBR06_SOUSAS2710048, partial [Sousa chinensis]